MSKPDFASTGAHPPGDSGATPRKRTVSLRRQLEFQRLLGEISSHFLDLPADQIDAHINQALARVATFLGFNLSAVSKFSGRGAEGEVTHIWTAEELPPIPPGFTHLDFPWLAELLAQSRAAYIPRVGGMPPAAQRDRETYERLGIESAYNWPLQVGGAVVGCFCVGSIGKVRALPAKFEEGLGLLVQVLGNALARAQGERALRESETRLILAAEAAAAGLWSLDLATGVFWLTVKTRELFCFPAEVAVTFEDFVKLVHPEDKDLVREAVRKLVSSRKQDQVEYRVILPDGSLHWILSRGQVHSDDPGKPGHLTGVSIRITDRKRLEESFRASEARLQAGSDIAGLGYFEANYSDRTCFLDRRFRQICAIPDEVQKGLEPVEFWFAHVDPVDRQRVQAEREALRDGRIDQISTEYRYLHPGLGQRWVHHLARLAQRHHRAGEFRTFGVIRDITEHKQLADEQAEDLRFGNLIADLSSKFVNLPTAEVDHAIEDAQRRVCEFLGLDVSTLWQPVNGSPGEYRLTHHYLSMGGPPITRMSAKDSFPWCQQQLLAGNVIAVSSMDRLPPEAAQDQEVWRHFGVKTSLTVPLSTGGVSVIGFLSFNDMVRQREWPGKLVNRLKMVSQIFANALARKLADQQLRESEEVNRATFDQAGVGIAHVGTDGRWLRVNDKLCAILGYSREELMGLNFQSITYGDDLETDLDLMRQLLAGQISNYSMAKRYLRKDRSLVWGNLTVSLVRNEAGGPKHFISVIEDITQRKRAEEETQRLRMQLWHADRVAQTGAITASLAHELNQPLTGILSTAQAGLRFLASGNPEPGLINEILTNIVHDTKRAGAVINGLRAMLRHKESQREPISLTDAIQGVLALAHSELIARQIDYNFDSRLAPDLRVVADKAQIQQVLLNLVMNSLEAMQDQPPEQRHLLLTLGKADTGEAEVKVRDSGPGIPDDQQDKVFMAFWTTKQQGMGIGLAISYSIIESHGGRLWCANNPEGGATFRFTLPIASAGAASRTAPGPSAPPKAA